MTTGELQSNSDITRQIARKRLNREIRRADTQGSPVLIEALPSIGKSRGVVEWAAESGESLTVLTSRNDLFNQYISWCRELGLTPRKLPSFHDDCATANGEHGDKWRANVRGVYRDSGLRPGEIHGQAKMLFGQELPCNKNGTCRYVSNRDFDPDEYEVLIGHYRHAHVPAYIRERYVAIDEFPEGEFLTTYSSETVNRAVSSYLDEHDSLPFSYVKDLEEYRRDPHRKQDGIVWFNSHNPRLRRDVAGAAKAVTGRAHAQAPSMTYAILTAEDLGNRWEYAKLPNGQRAVRDPETQSLTLLSRPSLGEAEGIVALDGTPTVEQWRLILGEDLQYRSIMSNEEKRSYLSEVLNLDIIQTVNPDVAKPYSGGGGVTVEKDLTLIEAISHREQCKPTLITSQAALRKYNRKGLSEFVGETAYYGNIKGSNRFTKTRVGIVAGSPHYGDGHIRSGLHSRRSPPHERMTQEEWMPTMVHSGTQFSTE